MGLITYSRDFLLSIARTTSQLVSTGKPIKPVIWEKLCKLNISKPTKRGCRSGQHKQRKILCTVTPQDSINCAKSNLQRSVCYSNLVSVKRTCTVAQTSVISDKISTSRLPSVFMCNPRSLNNKIDEFRSLILTLKVDVAMVSETWFSPLLPDGHLQIQGYSMFTQSKTDIKRRRSSVVHPQ